jgi:hypothetical protein
MISFKQGVNPLNVHPAIWVAVGVVHQIRTAINRDGLWITSMNDGGHEAGSLHYPKNAPDNLCRACDFRIHDLMRTYWQQFYHTVYNALDIFGFDVVLHDGTDGLAPHLHVEFQPKTGEHDIFAAFKFHPQQEA